MGNFYVNFTVRHDSADRVADELRAAGRSAFVAPAAAGGVAVFEEESEMQDPAAIEAVATLLSSKLQCPVLAVLNHDDDILCLWLFERGEHADSYNSCPGYFDDGPTTPEGGDAARLCAAFGATDAEAALDRVLRSEDEYAFALDRHQAIIEALKLPPSTLGTGHRYLQAGEYPPGLEASQLIRTP